MHIVIDYPANVCPLLLKNSHEYYNDGSHGYCLDAPNSLPMGGAVNYVMSEHTTFDHGHVGGVREYYDYYVK